MICDEYSKEKEGTMTVISNGSIKKKIFMLLMIQSIYFVKSRKKKLKKLVDSAHPPGAQAWKGTAVRSLRSYVSWVRKTTNLKKQL
jgi:hypothetical protein